MPNTPAQDDALPGLSGLGPCTPEMSRLTLENARLAMYWAGKYARSYDERMDYTQQGYLGLMRAAQTFDPVRGIAFSTWASWWIMQFITRYMGDTLTDVRLPTNKAAKRRAARKRWEEDPIADGVCLHRQLSGDAPAHRGTRDERDTLFDTVPDPGDTADELVVRREQLARVRAAVDRLDARTAAIVRARFGLDGEHDRREDGRRNPHATASCASVRPDMTLHEVAREHGLSRERIRQLQAVALRELRRDLERAA